MLFVCLNFVPCFSARDLCETEMLEIDCQRTKDDQIVISHDNHLLRGTGMDSQISDLLFSVMSYSGSFYLLTSLGFYNPDSDGLKKSPQGSKIFGGPRSWEQSSIPSFLGGDIEFRCPHSRDTPLHVAYTCNQKKP